MTDKLPPEEAWDAVVSEAMDDEAERVAELSDAELDAELAAKGVDPAAVRAKGAALAAKLMAKKAAASPPPDAARARDARRHAAPSARVIPLRVRTMLALAVAAGAAITMAMGGGAVVARLFHHEPPVDTGPRVPPAPPVVPTVSPQQELASALRKEALAACGAMKWYDCEDKLNQAARLDPAGEDVPDVQHARAAVKQGIAADQEKLNAKHPPQ